jgi:PPM family protein phosphatase
MKVESDFAGRQLIGSRESQDDYYTFCPLAKEVDGLDGLLLVLADGMGGYAGGSIASHLVVEAFIEHFCFARGDASSRLLSSLRASERKLQEEIARREERLSQMGSTLVGVFWCDHRLHWVSVGDSGLFLYREHVFRRLNADHSMAPVLAAQAARGEMTTREAAEHPYRNVLRSALALEPLSLFELRDEPYELLPGDIVIAASDGLNSVDPKILAAQLELGIKKSADQIASSLLGVVREARLPHQDNTTVAVIRVPA